ncbi:MAG: hypothetical protein RSE45_04100 [Bacilli bacterium]
MENNIVKSTKEINVWFRINPEEEEYLGEEWLEELNYFFSEGIVTSEEKENICGTGYGTGDNYIKCNNPNKFYEFLNFINDNRETLTVIKVIALDEEIGNITYIENRKYAEYIDINSVDGIKLVSECFARDNKSLMALYNVNDLDELQNIIKVNEDNNYEFIDFVDSLKEI